MSLLPEALSVRDYVRSLLQRLSFDCDFEWRPLPEVRRDAPVSYSAEDGGQNVRKLRTYSVVSAKAWGAGFPTDGRPVYVQRGFVGVMIPQGLDPSSRLRLYRQVLELEVADLATVKGGLVLFDGTPPMKWGKVGAKTSWDESLSLAAKVMIKGSDAIKDLTDVSCSDSSAECALHMIESSNKRPFSGRALLRLAAKGLIDEYVLGPDPRHSWILALESLERFYMFRKTVEDVWSKGSIPVFLVKTSRSTSFCRSSLPDVHVIEYALRSQGVLGPGYTIARVYNNIYEYFGLKPSHSSLYPDAGGLRSFYENRIGVISMFIRLRPGGYIFKAEVVFDNSSERSPDQLVNDVLTYLSRIPLSPEGYPLPLVTADYNARLSETEMEAVLRALGLDLVPESRSVLKV